MGLSRLRGVASGGVQAPRGLDVVQLVDRGQDRTAGASLPTYLRSRPNMTH
jgi:hypothetical protein